MSQSIRLDRVRVKNLFNRFAYDINFKNGENVSVLIAPNGCGKTTIFEMIHFIFNPTMAGLQFVQGIPFDFCECTLSNGKVLTLVREEHETQIGNLVNYIRDLTLRSGKLQNVDLILKVDGAKESVNMTETLISEELMTNPRYNELSHQHLDLSDPTVRKDIVANKRYKRYLEKFNALIGEGTIRRFQKENDCVLGIDFIRADRLHRSDFKLKSPAGNEQEEASKKTPLEDIQERTKQMYENIIEEYNFLQREMKDSLPKLYLESPGATMKEEEFIQRWNDYVHNIRKFVNLGLMEAEKTILEPRRLGYAYEMKSEFLTIYLESVEKTLEPFERNYQRLSLFVDILNRRNQVTGKEIRYGKEGIIVMVDGEKLPLDCLSSGEKNDLVMFYNLIFSSDKSDLVLIDEPEISLNIEWQEDYLDILLKICEMNGLQAIVATHSPNIVNTHINLYADKTLTYENK